MPDKPTLNRFPLFGLFAYRAALRIGHSDTAGRLLGYSAAVLYAIFKAKAQKQTESTDKEAKKKMPPEVKKAKTGKVKFGGQEFTVIYDDAEHLRKTVVGHEIQTPEKYDSQVEGKFPDDWHDRLAKAFDKYLEPHQPKELNTGNTLYELYKAWRDECKVGFNRVDLEKLVEWLEEHQGRDLRGASSSRPAPPWGCPARSGPALSPLSGSGRQPGRTGNPRLVGPPGWMVTVPRAMAKRHSAPKPPRTIFARALAV